ncbi:O-fucosyltransferase family protein [Hibiscus syriacus]|uniref:Exocyst subunit Exo70 family protein n=1 Tax=Hibiscus syriacus TaxID=106335 RepID=A0A6A2X9C7_HIBSY|nr:O-fucosyltransferase family protein [Hibiscus syriacus]
MSMAEVQKSIDNLLSYRNLLEASVDNSTALALALEQTGPRIAELDKRLALLEVAVRPGGSKDCSFAAVRDHIGLALGPAVAVLKILDSIRELEKSLLSDSGQDSDIFSYILTIRQFEEAKSSSLATATWRSNEELLATGEQAHRNGKLLCAELPGPILRKLLAIVEKQNGSNRIKNCISIFLEVRSLNARKSMQAIDLDYLEKVIKENDDVRDMESCIHEWSKHMEFIVKYVLENEHRLCKEVFGSLASGIWTGCFEKIAVESGILSFVWFGMNIAESKKDLVTKVVNGASEIFWELPLQVELERRSSPPSDRCIPRLVSFVTDYCNRLLDDNETNFDPSLENLSSSLLERDLGKILSRLCQDIPVSSTISNSPKKRLKAFNEAFDDMYKKQLNWVIIDESSRDKMHKLVVQTLVTAYASYLQKYSLVVEHSDVFYMVQSLENMLSTVLKPKQVKYTSSSTIGSHFTVKQKNAAIDQFGFTLTAM